MHCAFVTLAAAALVGGCASAGMQTGSTNSNPYPADYRKLAQDYVRSTFKDPYSIRDAQIAPPKLAMGPSLLPSSGFVTPWLICVKANAKNSFGAYAGPSPTVLLVYNNRVENSFENSSWSWVCADVKYEPFPEIMQTS
jgi:hypothetical protein